MKKLISLALTLAVLSVTPAPIAVATTCRAQHIVRSGENLFRIGLRYGVDWPSLARANNLLNPHLIFVGQVLCIPAVAPTPTASPTSTPTPTGTSLPADVASPTPTFTPLPPRPARGAVPTFIIVGVVRGVSVTIETANFPAGQVFAARMGAMGTRGLNGIGVGSIDSGAGGSFRVTFSIPSALRDARQIAIRLDSPAGYYSFNWFYNRTYP